MSRLGHAIKSFRKDMEGVASQRKKRDVPDVGKSDLEDIQILDASGKPIVRKKDTYDPNHQEVSQEDLARNNQSGLSPEQIQLRNRELDLQEQELQLQQQQGKKSSGWIGKGIKTVLFGTGIIAALNAAKGYIENAPGVAILFDKGAAFTDSADTGSKHRQAENELARTLMEPGSPTSNTSHHHKPNNVLTQAHDAVKGELAKSTALSQNQKGCLLAGFDQAISFGLQADTMDDFLTQFEEYGKTKMDECHTSFSVPTRVTDIFKDQVFGDQSVIQNQIRNADYAQLKQGGYNIN